MAAEGAKEVVTGRVDAMIDRGAAAGQIHGIGIDISSAVRLRTNYAPCTRCFIHIHSLCKILPEQKRLFLPAKEGYI